MHLFEPFKNLISGWRARHDPLAHTPGTGHAAHPAGSLVIRPVETQVEAQEVWSLLTEQIAHGWDKCFPQPGVNFDDTFRPTLIGAWTQDGLVAGAFVMPDEQDARHYALSSDDGAQVIRSLIAITQGIAVHPAHRREGIGLQIKLYCNAWAADHDARIMLSIITAHEALGLNHKAGHHVFPADVVPVIYIEDRADGKPDICFTLGVRLQTEGLSLWSLRILGQTTGLTIAVGQHPASIDPRRHPDKVFWYDPLPRSDSQTIHDRHENQPLSNRN